MGFTSRPFRSYGALAVLVSVITMGASALHQRAPQVVHVTAQDFSFIAPDSIRGGQLVLEFENRGQRDHELIVGLLRPGTTGADIIATHQKGLTFRKLQDAYLDGAAVGMLYAAPGTRSPARLTVPTIAGRSYILLCQLRDSVGAQSHALLGMFKVLNVR